MRYLLDTHALLWMRNNDPRLDRAKWEPVFFSGNHEILISIASLWEIAIKCAIGKLRIAGSIEEFAATLRGIPRFLILGVEVPHLARLAKLPLHHRDPFDRLLISQAIETGAAAVTDDPNWRRYPVKVRW